MELSPRGLRIIQAHEGLRLKAYLCPAGVPTIGYGTTRGVKMGDEITQAQAVELLAADAERFADAVRRHVDVLLNQNEFDALVSFVYNIGIGLPEDHPKGPSGFRGSTLLRKLNAGDREGAADELLRWNKGGGKVLPGLVKRREAERRLFLEPVEPDLPDEWIDEVDTDE